MVILGEKHLQWKESVCVCHLENEKAFANTNLGKAPEVYKEEKWEKS